MSEGKIPTPDEDREGEIFKKGMDDVEEEATKREKEQREDLTPDFDKPPDPDRGS